MANIKSAIKRIRTAETKRVANKTRLSRVRTCIKKVEAAVLAGDAAAAEAAFKAFQPEIQPAQANKPRDKNKVARTLSRLSGHVKGTKTKTKAA